MYDMAETKVLRLDFQTGLLKCLPQHSIFCCLVFFDVPCYDVVAVFVPSVLSPAQQHLIFFEEKQMCFGNQSGPSHSFAGPDE